MKSLLIEETIEIICGKGCQAVREDIARLEMGQNLAETAGMTRQQQALVLAELQSIMSGYGDSCSADGNLNQRSGRSVTSE